MSCEYDDTLIEIHNIMDFFQNHQKNEYFHEKISPQLRSLKYYMKRLQCQELLSCIQRKVIQCLDEYENNNKHHKVILIPSVSLG